MGGDPMNEVPRGHITIKILDSGFKACAKLDFGNHGLQDPYLYVVLAYSQENQRQTPQEARCNPPPTSRDPKDHFRIRILQAGVQLLETTPGRPATSSGRAGGRRVLALGSGDVHWACSSYKGYRDPLKGIEGFL